MIIRGELLGMKNARALQIFGWGSCAKRKSPDAVKRRGFLRGREILGLQLHSYHRLVLLFTAWRVEWNVGRLVAR